jgi:hypothetical protein
MQSIQMYEWNILLLLVYFGIKPSKSCVFCMFSISSFGLSYVKCSVATGDQRLPNWAGQLWALQRTWVPPSRGSSQAATWNSVCLDRDQQPDGIRDPTCLLGGGFHIWKASVNFWKCPPSPPPTHTLLTWVGKGLLGSEVEEVPLPGLHFADNSGFPLLSKKKS